MSTPEINKRYADAIRNLLLLGGATGGLGAAYGGYRALQRYMSPPIGKATARLPDRLDLGYLRDIKKKREEDERKRLGKAAAAVGKVAAEKRGEGDWLDNISQQLAEALPGSLKYDVSNPLVHHPLGLPAVALTGIGAGAAGYGSVKSLGDFLAQQRTERQLQKARKEYERALREQYEQSHEKESEEQQIRFDDLYEKAAQGNDEGYGFWTWLGNQRQAAKDSLGLLAGLYSAGLLGTGAVAHKLTYDWADSRSKRKAVERALEEERMRRMSRKPRKLTT